MGVDDTCVEPSKREDLTQCCFNIGPPPTALNNIETTVGQVLVFAGRAVRILIHACRLCLVGTGCTMLCVVTHQFHSVTSGGPALQTLGQQKSNIGSMLSACCAQLSLDWNTVGPALM